MSGVREKPSEFDLYARDYAELIRDPLRERFAPGNRFFVERKVQVIQAFYRELRVSTGGLRWLDVGCGQGELLRMGRPYFASAAGCDPSAAMLEACPQDLEFHHQEAIDRLDFNDGTFDFITAVCVYHHVPVQQRPSISREALRLLRPGGVFCVIEHNPLNPMTRLIVSRTPVDANAELLTAHQTRGLLAAAGARVLKTHYFLYFPERIHKPLARVEDRLAQLPFGGQYAVFAQRAR